MRASTSLRKEKKKEDKAAVRNKHQETHGKINRQREREREVKTQHNTTQTQTHSSRVKEEGQIVS